MERFFATLKAELPVTMFETHTDARAAVFDDIERFYNRSEAGAFDPRLSNAAARSRTGRGVNAPHEHVSMKSGQFQPHDIQTCSVPNPGRLIIES
jgi:hypothetical protein